MTTRGFLRLLGLSTHEETARARRAIAAARTTVSRDVLDDERAFERAMRAIEARRDQIVLGTTPSGVPYRIGLTDMTSLSTWVTGATGSGKSKLVASLLAQAAGLAVGGEQLSVAVLDPKGDMADECLRAEARFADRRQAAHVPARRLNTFGFFRNDWLPSTPILSARPGVDPVELGHRVADVLTDVLDDASLGARQHAMLAALFGLAATIDLPFAALPWLLADLSSVGELTRRVSHPHLRLELGRLLRESTASVDGLRARVGTLLQARSLRACLSGPVATDYVSLFEPGTISIFDFGGAEFGAQPAAVAIGALAFSWLVDAAFDPSRVLRGPMLIVIDEPTVLLSSRLARQQLERVLTLGRSRRTAVLLIHQGPGQFPGDLRSVLNTNIAVRIVGRSAERDALEAAEWFSRMHTLGEATTDAAERRRLTAMVATLPVRSFLVADRRETKFVPRRIEALAFEPPAWSAIPPALASMLRRGDAGFARRELEARAHTIETQAEAAYLARTQAAARTTEPSTPKRPTRRRGVVP